MRKKCAETPKFELIQHVLWQSYTRVVASHADALKNYKAFSNEVYGEVNPIFVKELVEKTGITRDSVFVDLGSGIGNVVLQVAAQTGCEAHGIEIMEKPAQLGIQQQKEFEARMKFFNKPFGKIHLYQGDMTQSGAIDRVLSRCDVIFVNNYVFSPTLNQQLLHKFLDLKEGSKIVSLKSFVPVDHKITIRNVDAVENILVVKEEMYYEEWVSWSAEGGKWYIHTVDRSRLKAFLEEMSGSGGRSSRRGG
ncbi:histone-lysine N-methyltransferase [Paraphysoderma sedebokerense]|nr:histone-lysine N-methyltransferase [Paraphysoderma sedebokerense]